MVKVYEVSRKYIVLFMHNNRYLPLTGLLTTYFVAVNYTACTHNPSSGKILFLKKNSRNFTSLSRNHLKRARLGKINLRMHSVFLNTGSEVCATGAF